MSKLVSRVRLRGVGASATYGGSVAAASALCAAIGPSASVLFMDAATAATFAPVVRALCGQPAALVVLGPSAASAAVLEQAVHSIEQVGRRPVLLGPTRVVGVTARGHAAAGGLAPDVRRRRGPHRPPGRHLAGHVLAWLAAPAGTGS